MTRVPSSSVAASDALWLLDTDVVSELRKAPLGRCDPRVRAWAASTRSSRTFLSAITIEELTRGVLHKERQDPVQGATLRRWLDDVILPAYEGRILVVDTEVARTAAGLHVPDPAPVQDALIAATALVNGLVVATGNVRDFARFEGLAVHDPWHDPVHDP